MVRLPRSPWRLKELKSQLEKEIAAIERILNSNPDLPEGVAKLLENILREKRYKLERVNKLLSAKQSRSSASH